MRRTNEDGNSRLREVSELELFFELEQLKASNLSKNKGKDAIIQEIKNRYSSIDLNAWVLNWKNYMKKKGFISYLKKNILILLLVN